MSSISSSNSFTSLDSFDSLVSSFDTLNDLVRSDSSWQMVPSHVPSQVRKPSCDKDKVPVARIINTDDGWSEITILRLPKEIAQRKELASKPIKTNSKPNQVGSSSPKADTTKKTESVSHLCKKDMGSN